MSSEELDALDQADMVRLVTGHDAALNDLMERHASPLFGFLCRFIGDEDAANDLAQETFARVYQHRADYQPSKRFSAWLFTIGGNPGATSALVGSSLNGSKLHRYSQRSPPTDRGVEIRGGAKDPG